MRVLELTSFCAPDVLLHVGRHAPASASDSHSPAAAAAAATTSAAGAAGAAAGAAWLASSFAWRDVVGDDDVRSRALPARFVRVALHASAANPVDAKLQRGDFAPAGLHGVLGHDGCGVVLACGERVTRVRPGMRVWLFAEGVGVCASNGTYAERIDIHECLLGVAPAAPPHAAPAAHHDAQCAASMVTGLTAIDCVARALSLRSFSALVAAIGPQRTAAATPRDVLVTGASGGVGAFCVQLLRHAGAHVVAITGRPATAQYLRERLGVPAADVVVVPPAAAGHSPDQVVAAVQACVAANGGRSFDAALDLVGGDMKRICLRAVAFGGAVVTIVEEPKGTSFQDAGDAGALFIPGSPVLSRCLALHFVVLGMRALMVRAEQLNAADAPPYARDDDEDDTRDVGYGDRLLAYYARRLDLLRDLVDAGVVRLPDVAAPVPLSPESVSLAHARLAAGVVGGGAKPTFTHNAGAC